MSLVDWSKYKTMFLTVNLLAQHIFGVVGSQNEMK
jgi:hypothetical protein